MNTNPSETNVIVENEKSGTPKGHQLAEVTPFPLTPRPTRAKLGKSDVGFWKARVRPRRLRDGKLTKLLYVRLRVGRAEAWVCLDCADVVTAAIKARDLWLKARERTLPTAVAEFHPKPNEAPAKAATVAAYIEVASTLSAVRPVTLAEYQASLLRVIAGVSGIAAKSDRVADRAEWRAKVGAVRLDQIAPADVRAWQREELEEARRKGGEVAKDRRAATLASHIRDARSLFAVGIVAEIRKTLILPEVLPFDGITAAAVTRRFVATVDARSLYADAAELDEDARTAFDLLLVGGLRRGEADALPWRHVDLEAGTVRIDVTEDFRPKSRESCRVVPLPRDVVERLKQRREAMPHASLVLERRLTRPARKAANQRRPAYVYHAKAWAPLTAWLRAKGVRDPNPLHVLRKFSGSWIHERYGLEVARQHLGHATITTTSRSYLAARTAVVDLVAGPSSAA